MAGRTDEVKKELTRALAAASTTLSQRGSRSTPGPFEALIEEVMGDLYTDPSGKCASPKACPTAELCFALTAFAIVHQSPIGELKNERGRVEGDRGVTDWLAKDLLRSYGIPAGQGAMQSSTLRSSYSASHARNTAAGSYIEWLDTHLSDAPAMLELLAEQFMLHQGLTLRPLHVPAGAALAFPQFHDALEELLAAKSNGALQQYLLAALLEGEAEHSNRPFRVLTKGLFTADAVVQSAGDITVVSPGGEVLLAYEVSASSWEIKVGQALHTLDEGLAPRVVIAADVPRSVTAEKVKEAIASYPGFSGQADNADIAVVDLTQLCLSWAATLPSDVLVNALKRTAELVRDNVTTRTDLVAQIENMLHALGAAAPVGTDDPNYGA